MSKKTSIILFATISIIILGITYMYLQSKKQDTPPISAPEQPTLTYDLKLEKRYLSENNWEYTVTGQFPNPCYKGFVEVIVAESYPEQVTVLIDVQEPSDDIVCAQVVSDFEYNGTFSASEQALVELELKEN